MQKFPNEFLFGVTTSSFQSEGAWNEDGKGENIWDRFIHTQPSEIRDGSNADVACDSYHKFKEDIQLVKEIGLSAYKFSISWSRILPNGNMDFINQAGIDHYRQVIDETIKNGIIPMATMYHYDLPQKLQDIGGWCNPLLIDYFADYARLLFKLFGDKIKWWSTFNEPTEMVYGYVQRRYAPFLSLECFDADYIVGHNVLRAHAKAYRIYDKEFRAEQQGKVSIVLCALNFKPKTNSKEDKDAEFRARQFTTGWFAHPIYSSEGDYPPVMRKLVDEKCKKAGRSKSTLPRFTEDEINEIKGSHDFFALNHYTSMVVSDNTTNARTMFSKRDANVYIEFGKDWPPTGAHWCKVVPWGIRELLCWIKEEYGNPPVYVSENGFCDYGGINDVGRINYLREYLQEILKAMTEHKCNVIGYHIWTLLDCFEWCNGFGHKYGLVSVNFESPNRERTMKLSASFVKRLCETRKIPDETLYE